MTEELRELRLPAELCSAAEKRFAANFGDLEGFLIHVLRELLREDADRMDQAEQKVIEERLKNLGYI